MCWTASWVFIHSLHLRLTPHSRRYEKAGQPSVLGPLAMNTPMFFLCREVEVTLLSMEPKCLGFSSKRS